LTHYMNIFGQINTNTNRCTATLFAIIVLLMNNIAQGRTNEHIYVTWPPVEPDKAIAIWLMNAHVDQNAHIVFIAKGNEVSTGIPFDIPGSDYIRNHKQSCSEVLIARHNIKDTKATALGKIARKLELAAWYATFTPHEQILADQLEHCKQQSATPDKALNEALQYIDKWQPE